jgi:hypothetical protein
MQKRSVAMVVILSIITFGIYALVWMVKTKNEMNTQGANIPTAWLIIVPVVSIWWMWKYAGGVEHVTRGKSSQVIAFILMFVLGVIGMAIIQDAFNKVADQGQLPNARAMG